MGGGREHRVAPVPGAVPARAVKGRDREAEAVGIAAHLVQGREPVIAVEGRVFDALGGDRRR